MFGVVLFLVLSLNCVEQFAVIRPGMDLGDGDLRTARCVVHPVKPAAAFCQPLGEGAGGMDGCQPWGGTEGLSVMRRYG